MQSRRSQRWNHNLHFHRVVLSAVPPHARSALDVGTGDGLLARDLRAILPDVTGIDVDRDTLARAAQQDADVRWVLGDVMTLDLARTFDVVASVATLHHLPMPAALRRLAELTAPGGVLIVVGLATSSTWMDLLRDLLGVVQHRWYSRTRTFWEHTAPTLWPPPHTFMEIRKEAAIALPGARWRRFALWRYAVIWRRPHEGAIDGSTA